MTALAVALAALGVVFTTDVPDELMFAVITPFILLAFLVARHRVRKQRKEERDWLSGAKSGTTRKD